MSFSIFAVGVTGHKQGGGRGQFNYSKDNCLDRGDFDPPALLSILPPSPNAAGVAEKIIGSPDSHLGAATVSAMTKLAEIEMAHLVTNAVSLLAINCNRGQISVYCHKEQWYWADANSFETFYFGGSDPGRDFLKKIGPGLVKTELNNFGVLAQIAIAISKYDGALPSGNDSFLSISLRH